MVDTWPEDTGNLEEVDEALRAFRTDVPPMGPEAFATGRARLTAAIGTPALAEPAEAPAEPVVLALPTTTGRRSPPERPAELLTDPHRADEVGGRFRRSAPWLAAAAAVAVVAAGAVALLPSGAAPIGAGSKPGAPQTLSSPPPSSLPETTPAGPLAAMPARPLNSAGDLAAVASDVTLKPGEVLYVKSTQTEAPSAGAPGGTLTLQLWVPSDRDHAYWLVKRASTGEIKGAPDGGYSEQQAPGGKFEGNTYTGPEESPWSATPNNVAAMPRDPTALYAKLRADVNGLQVTKPNADQAAATVAINNVFTLLADQFMAVPADLRAALLRTLGYLPGVTVTQGATSTDGQPAVSLSWQLDNRLVRYELLLDPSTARTIEYRTVATATAKGFQAGQTMSSAVRTEAVVHALGQLP